MLALASALAVSLVASPLVQTTPSANSLVTLNAATLSPTLAAPLAILRAEPLGVTGRAQDEALLDAPDADLSRWLSPDEMVVYHAFRRPRWIRALADLALQGAVFFWLVLGGLGSRVYARCEKLQGRIARTLAVRAGLRTQLASIDSAMARVWGSADWPAALLFASALAALGCAVLWPTSLIFDWAIPRHHGLSTQTLLRWTQLSLLALLIQALGVSALAFGLWGLMRRVKKIWLWLGVPAGVLIAIAGLADPLSLKLRNELVPLPAGPARNAIERVLERASVSAEEIDRIDARRDTLTLDAFVSGQGATRRIVLFDTLVDALTPQELASVVAHELGHVRDGSRRARVVAAGLSVPLLLFLLFALLEKSARSRRFGFSDARDVRALPLVLLTAWLALVAAMPLSNKFARDRELRADLFALDLTRDPTSFRAALVKLAKKNQLDPAPPKMVAVLLYDHPTLAKRLGLIDAWQAAADAGDR